MSAASEMVADLRSAPCEDFRQSARDMRATAEHLIAEGWTKPRTVTTAAELDAMPVGSVVLDSAGDAWQRVDSTLKGWTCSPCDAEEWRAEDVIREWGPATVLHEPEEGQ